MKHQETARRLRSAMEEKGIIAQELADRSGVKKSSISQYINGSHKPSNQSSGAMAAVLNVNPLWLMGFDVDRRPDADKFRDYSDAYNKAHTKFLSTRELQLIDGYRKLNADYQDHVFSIVSKLCEAQQEEDYLAPLAAHERTGIEKAPENESHDKTLIKDMAKQNNDN